MVQVSSFPADFTQAAIIELNSSFLVQFQGVFLMQAFIETGSNEPFVCASLINTYNMSSVKFLMAAARTDSSGDNGVLITLVENDTPSATSQCTVFLLQKGALRYQNPRRFTECFETETN